MPHRELTVDDDSNERLITSAFHGIRAFFANSERSITSPEFMDEKYQAGEYPYIQLNPFQFLNMLDLAIKSTSRRKGDIRFIDAGCGLGDKLVLASFMGIIRPEGIEISDKYCEWAEINLKLFQVPNKLHRQDITTFDYSSYDIVYYYHPMTDKDRMKEFEHRVMDTIRPGAIIMGLGPNLYQRMKNGTLRARRGFRTIKVRDGDVHWCEADMIVQKT